jgi:hypothetical protein
MIIAHEILCFMLFYSVFCRAVRMDHTTRPGIRISLQVMGTVAAIGIAVPLHWRTWMPDWFTLAMLASITALQLVTAYHWVNGVPSQFTMKPRGQNEDN